MKTWHIIENCVVTVCFTAIAIAFNHWWIILISILFVNIPRKRA